MTTEIAPGSKLFLQRMRLFAAFATLFVASACAGAGAAATSTGDAAPGFRTVSNAAYAERTEPGSVVALDEAAYRNAWDSMIGAGEARAIDFTTETAVLLFGGERSTGGYSVEVRGVTLEGDTLVVDGGVQGPPAGSITTQALTSPYAVIAVQSRAIRNVRWTP
ncbi:MAG TPA: protease complex subunit PrcB family protein [Thermoanaerobaculia bacterium]|nr:protease complex subunit PrcB family protein [Thermoanaerobaculia bacterium]